MSQSYVIVARRNPIKPMLPAKFYAQARSGKKVSVKEICQRVSERSSFSTGELVGAIGEFLIELRHVMEEGNIAQMGDLGNFRLTLKTATPAETADKFKSVHIKSCAVRFHPSVELLSMCRNMKFTPYNPEGAKEDDAPAEAPKE